MTELDLETRLRSSIGAPLPESEPDPAAWHAIEQRIERHLDGDTDRTVGKPPTGLGFRAALTTVAAGLLALAAWIGASSVAPDRRADPAEPAEASSAVPLPDPPSYWWLAAVAVAGVTLCAVVEWRRRDRLVSTAVAAALVGVLTMAAFIWPIVRHGAAAAALADDIPGYEVAEVDLAWWPVNDRFRAADVRLVRTSDADPATSLQDEAAAARAGFRYGDYRLADSCRSDPEPASPTLVIAEARRLCLVNADADGALLSVPQQDDFRPLLLRLLGYPVLALSLVLFALRLAQAFGHGAEYTPRRQVTYGLALTLVACGVYLLGLFAVSALDVGRLHVEEACGADQHVLDNPECVNAIAAELSARGATESANVLYGPVLVFGGALAWFSIAVGWAAGVATTPSRKRRSLLTGLTAAAVACCAVLVALGPTISVLTQYLE